MKLTFKTKYIKRQFNPVLGPQLLIKIPAGSFADSENFIKQTNNDEINISLDNKKGRTLDQNSLMWSLYKILANETTGGIANKGIPEQLYIEDLKNYAKEIKCKIPKEALGSYQGKFRICNIEEYNNCYIIYYYHSSSMMSTVEMAYWLEMLFNRLANMGVAITEPQKIKDYWLSWRKILNKKKICLHDNETDLSLYRENNPVCEACGKFIHYSGGSNAHIRARGMGGHERPESNMTNNILRLCDICHKDLDHDTGFRKFMKKHPHLSYKISRQYDIGD
jgi:hypothetical protein